jgi:histone H1/5
MSYKAGIMLAITELKDRNGSTMIAIKKHMQSQMAADEKWVNVMFLAALKSGVASGDFMHTKVRLPL